MFRETKPELQDKAYIGPTHHPSIWHLTLATKSEKWVKMKKLSDEWLGHQVPTWCIWPFFKKNGHNCPADKLDRCHMSFGGYCNSEKKTYPPIATRDRIIWYATTGHYSMWQPCRAEEFTWFKSTNQAMLLAQWVAFCSIPKTGEKPNNPRNVNSDPILAALWLHFSRGASGYGTSSSADPTEAAHGAFKRLIAGTLTQATQRWEVWLPELLQFTVQAPTYGKVHIEVRKQNLKTCRWRLILSKWGISGMPNCFRDVHTCSL